eukprot:SAG11_NODE_1062_length_5998_cov_67.555518_3_plen_52_part_00
MRANGMTEEKMIVSIRDVQNVGKVQKITTLFLPFATMNTHEAASWTCALIV